MAVQNLLIFFLVALVLLVCIDPAFSAGKKKLSKEDKEVEKVLEDVLPVLTPLTQKAAARGLFSPKDMSQTQEVKLQLLDLIRDYPTSELLVKPSYEAGRLLLSRELYDDAYDFFNYIQTNFADSPYASKSRIEIYRMKQLLGEQYFSEPMPASSVDAPPATMANP